MRKSPFTYQFLVCLVSFVILGGTGRSSLAADPTPDWLTDIVRVSIMGHSSLHEIVVTPRAAAVELQADGRSWQVPADEPIHIRRDGLLMELKVSGERFSAASIAIEGAPQGAFDVGLDPSSAVRTYTGSLDITLDASDGDLRMVNRVPLEDYVASVIGSEYGLNDIEGTKAMAVVARTYALYALSQDRDLHDSERSQVYEGLQKANAATRNAAFSTAGQVLMYDGQLIEAVYSASNGGRTASNESAWGSTPLPYFQSRKDPWDQKVSPHASWSWDVDAKKLEEALSRAFNTDVRGIKVTETARDGRVTEVRLDARRGSKTISGSAFRAVVARSFGAMTLRSSYFDLKSGKKRYSFDGRGFGHGVGLSQWGAHGMALDGRSYADILNFYYPGARIEETVQQGDIPATVAEAFPSVESDDATANAEDVTSSGKDPETVASAEAVTEEEIERRKSIEIAQAERDNSAIITALSIWGKNRKASRSSSRKPSGRSGW